MEKRWVLKPAVSSKEMEELAQKMKFSKEMTQLLFHRGIETYDQAHDFFRPSLDKLHDPFLMVDMAKAIDRIEEAIAKKEKILIYGDYDVDGTTAVSLLYNFLLEYTTCLLTYIPDRYAEGYGISLKGIDYAKDNGCALIIALDCGIRSIHEVEYAKGKGIDFIIGDHHLPGERVPQAVAVLDPHRQDCSYPYKDLSGCGIAFKIAQAFLQKRGGDISQLEKYLDVLAISIISDIVPMTGENRMLTQLGLKRINENPCAGIRTMLELMSETTITCGVREVAFDIGPQINAAGRIEHAHQVVEMLTHDDEEKIKEIAENIRELNRQRKELDRQITKEALQLLQEEEKDKAQRKINLVYHPDWHKGVVGIVASRVIEKVYRPTLILTKDEQGKITGSARSIHGVDIHGLLSQCEDLLDRFGGHPFAAGMTLDESQFDAFRDKMHVLANETITDEMLIEQVLIDTVLPLRRITDQFLRRLKLFEPHGPKNPRPVFLTQKVQRVGGVLPVGTNHLKFRVKQGDSLIFDCIGFGMEEKYDLINQAPYFDICYTIGENEWKGQVTTQFHIKGVRESR